MYTESRGDVYCMCDEKLMEIKELHRRTHTRVYLELERLNPQNQGVY